MNAKTEFLILVDRQMVKCAIIFRSNSFYGSNELISEIPENAHILKVNNTSNEYDAFVNSLDFEYDNGYGGQELFGIIWFEDETWATRGEYDGSEWWEIHKLPEIPKELIV